MVFRDVVTVLQGPWRVTALHLDVYIWDEGGPTLARQVVDYLAERTPAGGRLPELVELRVKGALLDVEDVTRMVVARSTCGLGGGAEDDTRCVPLAKLAFSSDQTSTNPDGVEALRDLLGEGVLEHSAERKGR